MEWKHKFLNITIPSDEVQTTLDSYGHQHYELVSADIKTSAREGLVNLVAFFKRPLDSKSSASRIPAIPSESTSVA